MSNGPFVKVGAAALGPLVDVAKRSKKPGIRIAALGAMSRFPLSPDAWRVYGGVVRRTLEKEKPGTLLRRSAIEMGVRVPLTSVREVVRWIAAKDRVDARVARYWLDSVGDPSGINPLIAQFRSGNATTEAYRLLARMPLETSGVKPADIPKLRAKPGSNTALWRSLALARLGDYAALDAFLAGLGNKGAATRRRVEVRRAVASVLPLPAEMQQHLLARMPEMVIEMAGRGIHPRSRGYTEQLPWQPIAQGLSIDSKEIAQWVFDETVDPDQMSGIRLIPSPYLSSIVGDLVHEGNRRAQVVRGRKNTIMLLGNRILETLPGPGVIVGDLPVGELVLEQVKTKYTALDDHQLAYVIAHDSPEHLIGLTPELVEGAGKFGARVIDIVGNAGDFQAGRGGAPMRGGVVAGEPEMHLHIDLIDDTSPTESADNLREVLLRKHREEREIFEGTRGFTSGEDAASQRRHLMDELEWEAQAERSAETRILLSPPYDDSGAEPQAAATEPQKSAEPPPQSSPVPAHAEPPKSPPPSDDIPLPPEERRVHAQIFHDEVERRTFVAGGEHIITVTIGLRGKVLGTAADNPIPGGKIPDSGVTLDVVLTWRNQTYRDKLFLPADRRKSSTSCDLPLKVPDDTQVVSAEIAFLYQGRIFEIVAVEAIVLAKKKAEKKAHRVQVAVQMQRRQVVDLSNTKPYGAALVINKSLRIYDEGGAHDFELQDSENATTWLNNALFVTQDTLVRRRAVMRDGEPQLDAEDDAVRTLLIKMARHGAVMFNGLEQQGFIDRGPRLQVVNYDQRRYVPIEFIYDLGHPLDDARICPDGLEALATEKDKCPSCSQLPLTADARTKMPKVCPLGFWSMQKVIERIDLATDAKRQATGFDAPSDDRRYLPAFDAALFASSHIVPDDERVATREAFEKAFIAAKYAGDWEEWKLALDTPVPLLIALPHHGVQDSIDYLQIGAEGLTNNLGKLVRSQLNVAYVNPLASRPGPVVLLLGCRTNAQTEDGYSLLAQQFRELSASIVVGTTAEILGKHAGPVAREFVRLLLADEIGEDFGAVMRRARRQMLARGFLMSIGVIALGDAEWRLVPRAN